MLYLSGQIGIHPKTGQLISDDVRDQTHQILENLEAVLNAGGSSVDQLVHCLIMLTNIEEDYEIVNEIYSQWFKSSKFYPARSSIGAAKLAFNAKVAIECQAYTTKQIE
jgi:2-iminobutanoate/2-iminopropanoate deaminase